MPQQTYSIGFGQNDFFSSDTSQNNLLQTIPFDISNLKAWCNSIDPSYNTTSSDPSIVFESKTSKLIIDNSKNFIENYMPGNISINNNFNSLAIGLTASNAPSETHYAPIRGNIVINDSSMNLDISAGDMIYHTQNGNWNPEVTISAYIPTKSMLQYNPPPSIDSSANQNVTVSVNTRNPRCKFVNNCKENHPHYASCNTIIKVDKTGQSYCECVCSGPETSNSNSHSHCNTFNINENGTNTGGLDAAWVTNYLQATTLTSVLKNIKMNLNATFPNTSYTDASRNVVYDISMSVDLQIRNAIYDYYAEVIKNRQLQTRLSNKQTYDNTSTLISQDAIRSYRKQYLELFNVTTGIFLASAYIYISMK